ncbi:hypothetical protein RHCRD62_20322 [Rhodococcus sp. RD6.2]|nr:hypothetical protein RHCRD62_20322 [Rhodococcus sp. RD6.2]
MPTPRTVGTPADPPSSPEARAASLVPGARPSISRPLRVESSGVVGPAGAAAAGAAAGGAAETGAAGAGAAAAAGAGAAPGAGAGAAGAGAAEAVCGSSTLTPLSATRADRPGGVSIVTTTCCSSSPRCMPSRTRPGIAAPTTTAAHVDTSTVGQWMPRRAGGSARSGSSNPGSS